MEPQVLKSNPLAMRILVRSRIFRDIFILFPESIKGNSINVKQLSLSVGAKPERIRAGLQFLQTNMFIDINTGSLDKLAYNYIVQKFGYEQGYVKFIDELKEKLKQQEGEK